MTDIFTPDMIVLAAGLSFVFGYLIINQVILRMMTLLGSSLYIWFYAVAGEAPLWTAIWVGVAQVTTNIFGLSLLFAKKSKLAIPKEHSDIYPQFATLPPGDFRSLVRMADRHKIKDAQTITTEGAPVDTLYYILSGKVVAQKQGHEFDLPPNIFVGEVAFLTGNPSSATTQLSAGAEVLKWDISALRHRASKNDRFKLALEALISTDLAAKVSAAVSPRMSHAKS